MIPIRKYWLTLVVGLALSTYVDGKQCKRFDEKPRCYLSNPVEEKRLTTKVHEAIAGSRQYLQQQLNHPQPPHIRASMKMILALTNLHYDSKNCDKTTNITEQVKDFSYSDLKKLPGGKLAVVLMGMQATCSFQSKEEQHKAILLLKQKMKAFPKGEFNHFFQYSLAIIALYNNGEHIPSEFGRTLINKYFLRKNWYTHLFSRDTIPVALVALKAIRQQKVTHDPWVHKHAVSVLQKAEKSISTILKNEDNYDTFILFASVFDISQKSICNHTMMRILSYQMPDGSFGMIPTTIRSMLVLSGYSKLILKDIHCHVQAKATKVTNEIHKETNKKIGDQSHQKYVNKLMIKVNISISYAVPGLTHHKDHTRAQIPSGMTALDALYQASKMNPCFTARTKLTAWGKQIIELCGMEQNHDKRMYWMFYVNDKMANVGPSTYKPNNGDNLRFTLTKF